MRKGFDAACQKPPSSTYYHPWLAKLYLIGRTMIPIEIVFNCFAGGTRTNNYLPVQFLGWQAWPRWYFEQGIGILIWALVL